MIRKIGFLVSGLGVLVLAWLAFTMWQGDPFTSLYTTYEQHQLASQLTSTENRWAKSKAFSISAASRRATASARQLELAERTKLEAVAYASSLKDGDALGRIIIPRFGLNMVVVQGTTTSDLERGPGHYDAASGETTSLPGMGGVIGIAGHRTTFLHPFRHIDELKIGDKITVVMPYGTFRYTVERHEIVSSTDWSILKHQPFEELVLSACHPLYSASHRYVIFARLSSSTLATHIS
jgi:sortase A